MNISRPKILIIEDARGVAFLYKKILEDEYDVTLCYSGEEAIKCLEEQKHFDLIILDVVLPTEDEKYTLEDCSQTGYRLLMKMIKDKVSSRFYVITVKCEMKEMFENICNNFNVILKFEAKIDHQPEKLVSIVKNLLEKR